MPCNPSSCAKQDPHILAMEGGQLEGFDALGTMMAMAVMLDIW
jgi:hypothetical protein